MDRRNAQDVAINANRTDESAHENPPGRPGKAGSHTRVSPEAKTKSGERGDHRKDRDPSEQTAVSVVFGVHARRAIIGPVRRPPVPPAPAAQGDRIPGTVLRHIAVLVGSAPDARPTVKLVEQAD